MIPDGMLPQTCTIRKRTVTSTTDGGESEYAWTDNQTGVRCQVKDLDDQTSVADQGETKRKTIQVFLPATATIAAKEYQIVLTIPGFAGTYDIVGVNQLYLGTTLHHLEVVARLL